MNPFRDCLFHHKYFYLSTILLFLAISVLNSKDVSSEKVGLLTLQKAFQEDFQAGNYELALLMNREILNLRTDKIEDRKMIFHLFDRIPFHRLNQFYQVEPKDWSSSHTEAFKFYTKIFDYDNGDLSSLELIKVISIYPKWIHCIDKKMIERLFPSEDFLSNYIMSIFNQNRKESKIFTLELCQNKSFKPYLLKIYNEIYAEKIIEVEPQNENFRETKNKDQLIKLSGAPQKMVNQVRPLKKSSSINPVEDVENTHLNEKIDFSDNSIFSELKSQITLEPHNPVLYKNLGDEYLKSGFPNAAADYYGESLKLNPSQNGLWLKTAHLNEQSGDIKKAQLFYGKGFLHERDRQIKLKCRKKIMELLKK